MELSTRGRSAVMAVAAVSQYGVDRAVSPCEIAERQRLSEAYLRQIFAELRRAGLVKSMRGRNGGYKLARPAENISVGYALAAVEKQTIETFLASVSRHDIVEHGLQLKGPAASFATWRKAWEIASK